MVGKSVTIASQGIFSLFLSLFLNVCVCVVGWMLRLDAKKVSVCVRVCVQYVAWLSSGEE